MSPLLVFALGAVFLALVLFFISTRQRRSAGIPAGRIIYSDTSRWNRLEKPLYDPQLNLTGRPDYLVEQGEVLIPVEVKSRRINSAAYDSHIFQLAAYCLLVEVVFGKRPPYGILHYANRTLAIDYTPELESALRELIAEIHAQERQKEIDRSHDAPERCRACGFRSICDQALR